MSNLIQAVAILMTVLLSSCDCDETDTKLSEVDELLSYREKIKEFEQITALGLEDLGDKKLMEIGDNDQNIDHLTKVQIDKYKLLLKDSGAKRVTITRSEPKYPVVSFLLNSSGFVFGGCSSEVKFSYLMPQKPEWAGLYIYLRYSRTWHGEIICDD